jgi:hypothetical protein
MVWPPFQNGRKNFRIAYNPNMQGHDFYYLDLNRESGKKIKALPIQFVECKPDERLEPFLSVRDGEEGVLQQMMDALWAMGIRPTDRGTVDSTLKAKDEHLSDLREVAFHALGLPRPAQGNILR